LSFFFDGNVVLSFVLDAALGFTIPADFDNFFARAASLCLGQYCSQRLLRFLTLFHQ
jgi:hypothetical protein